MRRERGAFLREVRIGKPEGRRPFGRPRRRWWNSTRENINMIGPREKQAEN